jgi:hypothetical protein
MCLLLGPLLAGCSKESDPAVGQSGYQLGTQPISSGHGPPPQQQVSRTGGILSKRDEMAARNQLDQIGKTILIAYLPRGRGPAKLEELKDQMRDMPKHYEAIRNGTYVLVPNARLASDSIMLYEKNPETTGMRLVVTGNGGVQRMGQEEFQAALKGQGR